MTYKDQVISVLRERDGDDCIHCGQVMVFGAKTKGPRNVSIEHIIPKARGGPNKIYNFALAHFDCNQKRGCKPITQEANIPVINSDQIVCSVCGSVFPDIQAVLHHRVAAHGLLPNCWIIEEAE